MSVMKKLVIASAMALAVVIVLVVSYQLTIHEQDTLYQITAFNVFSAGNFEGNTSFAELARQGDFGIGTLNGLNGEMIALNGKFYQIPTDSSPREISASEKTPYATVTFFTSDQTLQVTNLSRYSQLKETLNATLPNLNKIYAIKIHGYFNSAQTRSVPIQTKPYPTLAKAIENQTIFNLTQVEGTLVGFFFPDSMNGVDATGYHLHFLTDDHTAGGHMLECSIKNATVEIDQTNNYHLLIT